MDEKTCYVYIAKDEDDFNSISASAVIKDKFLPLFLNEQMNCFIICKTEACDELEKQLRNKSDLGEAILKFFNECRKNRVFGDAEKNNQRIIFLIHFGGRNEKVCREETRRMNQAVSGDDSLNKHSFVSVSRFHQTPIFFFTDTKEHGLRAPVAEDDLYEENGAKNQNDPFDVVKLIKKWEENGSIQPDYDHLRGITILCRAILEMGEKERDSKLAGPGTDWWFQTIWNGTHPQDIKKAFSKVEQRVVLKDVIIKNFCSEFYKKEVNLKNYDKDLSNIMSEITETLNNINQGTAN